MDQGDHRVGPETLKLTEESTGQSLQIRTIAKDFPTRTLMKFTKNCQTRLYENFKPLFSKENKKYENAACKIGGTPCKHSADEA